LYIHSVVIRLACIRQVARVPGEPRSNSNCNINNILKYSYLWYNNRVPPLGAAIRGSYTSH
jgi:hypothetical protein